MTEGKQKNWEQPGFCLWVLLKSFKDPVRTLPAISEPQPMYSGPFSRSVPSGLGRHRPILVEFNLEILDDVVGRFSSRFHSDT